MFSQYKYPDPCSFSFSKQFTTYMRIEAFCLSIENNDKRKQLQMKMKKYKREEERKKLIFKVGTIRKTSYCWPNSNPTLPCTLERKKPQCLARAYKCISTQTLIWPFVREKQNDFQGPTCWFDTAAIQSTVFASTL